MSAETNEHHESEAAVELASPALRFEDLPDFLTIRELRDWLRIGSNTAYALAKKPGFPVMRWGTKLVFPKDQVRDWVRQEVERGKLPRRLRGRLAG